MSTDILIIWVSPDLAKNLPLTREFDPVYEWDSGAKVFSSVQSTKDGLPIWQSEALIKVGWNADLRPVKVRLCSTSKPLIKPDPQKLAQLLIPASGSVQSQPVTPSKAV